MLPTTDGTCTAGDPSPINASGAAWAPPVVRNPSGAAASGRSGTSGIVVDTGVPAAPSGATHAGSATPASRFVVVLSNTT